jgi:hypothetical protein
VKAAVGTDFHAPLELQELPVPEPGPCGHAGAELLDPADPLMSGDERWRRLDRPVTAGGVDVGMAQAAVLDMDQHLARSLDPGGRRRVCVVRAGVGLHDRAVRADGRWARLPLTGNATPGNSRTLLPSLT